MVSDLLYEAEQAIRDYLRNPVFDRVEGEMRDRIEGLIEEMRTIGMLLDTPPDAARIADEEIQRHLYNPGE
jgi:hypothetical protein